MSFFLRTGFAVSWSSLGTAEFGEARCLHFDWSAVREMFDLTGAGAAFDFRRSLVRKRWPWWLNVTVAASLVVKSLDAILPKR